MELRGQAVRVFGSLSEKAAAVRAVRLGELAATPADRAAAAAEPGRTRRVLIVYHHQLFAQGLSRLLAADPAIQVIGAQPWSTALPEVIEKQRPDVVLVDHAPGVRGCELLCLAFSSVQRVIHLALEGNEMRITDRTEVPSPGVSDLISAIHMGKSPGLTGHRKGERDHGRPSQGVSGGRDPEPGILPRPV